MFAWLSQRADYLGNLSDSAIYLVAAEVLSPWVSAQHPAGYSVLFDYQFPPLYPLMLGLLGGGAHAPAASYRVDAVFDALVIGISFLFAKQVLGSVRMAAAASMLLTLMPGVLHQVLGLYSESLYMILVFTTLVLAQRRISSQHAELAAACCAGFSVLARSAGMGLIAALIVCRLQQGDRRPSTAWWCLLLGPGLAWQLVRTLGDAGPGYSASILRESWIETLALLRDAWLSNLHEVLSALGRLLDLNGGHAAVLAMVLVLVFALPTWFDRLRRWHADAWYVVFYAGLVSLWPYPEHLPRFMFPLLPLLLVYCAGGVRYIWARAEQRITLRMFALLPVASLLIAAAPALLSILATTRMSDVHSQGYYMRSPQWYRFASFDDGIESMNRIESMLADMQEIDARLPNDACVSSAAAPYVLLYGRRRTLRIPPANATAQEFREALERCPYVFMIAAEQWPSHGYPPLYPYHRITGELDVLQVRLWDSSRSSGMVRTMLARFQPGTQPAP